MHDILIHQARTYIFCIRKQDSFVMGVYMLDRDDRIRMYLVISVLEISPIKAIKITSETPICFGVTLRHENVNTSSGTNLIKLWTQIWILLVSFCAFLLSGVCGISVIYLLCNCAWHLWVVLSLCLRISVSLQSVCKLQKKGPFFSTEQHRKHDMRNE